MQASVSHNLVQRRARIAHEDVSGIGSSEFLDKDWSIPNMLTSMNDFASTYWNQGLSMWRNDFLLPYIFRCKGEDRTPTSGSP
jgi:hypothetical protein